MDSKQSSLCDLIFERFFFRFTVKSKKKYLINLTPFAVSYNSFFNSDVHFFDLGLGAFSNL